MTWQKRYQGYDKKNPSHLRLYNIWFDMKRRCYQKQNKRWEKYGGRGITICDEWRNNFQAFFDWSMTHGYADHLTIDRVDLNGNYTPDNCRWADKFQQANNRTNNHYLTYHGEKKTMVEWSRYLNMNYSTLRQRIQSGWSVEDAFEKPVGGALVDN